MRIRRAILSVSDKSGIVELARALANSGAELVASGGTARALAEAGLSVLPVERISGSPEAFQGRMKTLSFPICGGILYRRGDESDERDRERLSIPAIDCVVVNFYPFEEAAARAGISEAELTEEIDIGGPTLVRAAAKNWKHVLVATDPGSYGEIIAELGARGEVSGELRRRQAARAWTRVASYDAAIAGKLGSPVADSTTPPAGLLSRELRYGENPHQEGWLDFDPRGPIDWSAAGLSYNNILDAASAYSLASDLVALAPEREGVVIVKHNGPCGVALGTGQLAVLQAAWEGDPVSAFGGVLAFTKPLEAPTASWLAERFIEVIAAPSLDPVSEPGKILLARRKNLRLVPIRRFSELPEEHRVTVPGGVLRQGADLGFEGEVLRSVTKTALPERFALLAKFGIAVARSLKSNAIALVRERSDGILQLVGGGAGQPNRVDSLRRLALPRAVEKGANLADCILVSDAFFPFRDTVDVAAEAGIRFIVQPGGSIRDGESIAACDEKGLAMGFTGKRHFRH